MTRPPHASAVDTGQLFIGIDLGTSSVKVIALDLSGTVVGRATAAYPISVPAPGRAEQDPRHWWQATCTALRTLLASPAVAGRLIAGVGVTGQMHGLVLVDRHGAPVRDAVIWPDQRATDDVRRLTQELGGDTIHQITGMPASVGFSGPTLSWIRRQEPEVYARARHALLPKDHLRWRLTGDTHTDPTDAGGTLLFDLATGRWSQPLVAACGVRSQLLPDVLASTTIAGTVTPEAAAATGLAAGTPVTVGAGDQATAATALSLRQDLDTALAVSSGGTVLQYRAAWPHPHPPGVHRLLGAEGERLLMGATLSAGLAVHWLAQTLHGPDPDTEQVATLVSGASAVPAGADGLLFLPYLSGERTPHLDPDARGGFLGLSREHTPAHLTRALLEGVAMSLRTCLETVADAAHRPPWITVCGGGAHHPVWRQIIADVIGTPLRLSPYDEQSAVGAALLAARATGHTVTPAAPHLSETVTPHTPEQARYARIYPVFQDAYRTTRDLLRRLPP